ncbi:hypothetical protein BOX15_Mlig002649g1, partial [Macrostomum lignano]
SIRYSKIMTDAKYIAVLDVGSSSARVHIYNEEATIILSKSAKVTALHPEPLQTEYDPEDLWKVCKGILEEAFAEVAPSRIRGLGITVMRNSVTAWERDSGKPLMPIISWQDRRAGKDCTIWNRSLRMRAFRAACWALYKLTGRAKFLAASVLQFKIGMPVIQLVKLFAENPALLERARRGEICVGCNESWLLWRLTEGRTFATDYSCASTTGMYDPFGLEWSPIVVSALLHMPLRMLPEVRPTAGQFGHTDLFPGGPVDITSISGDQSAATFGELCHQPDQVKVTLGTGTFLDWNTGKEPYASMKGLYPVIGWVLDGDQSGPTYMIEGSHADTGNTLDWGCAMGFYPSVSEAESAALTVADSGGVFFVPCFTWSAVPVFDPAACAGFLGVNLGTSREHMARALLEAVIFQTKAIAEAFRLETGKKPAVLRCNGGVSASDFIMQGIADLLDCDVVRGSNREATSLGCAFLTAIAAGLWSQAEIGQRFDSIERRFQPRPEAAQRLARDYEKWKVAVQRCYSWY